MATIPTSDPTEEHVMPDPAPTVADPVRAHREAVVREHMDSENRLDFEATLATFTHPRYELIASGEVFDGEAEVREYYARSRTAFPDQRNVVHALHHTDDAVIVEFDLLGTNLGPLGTREPTGREFSCRMVAFFFFAPDDEGRDGIVCERVYFDAATIRRQLTASA